MGHEIKFVASGRGKARCPSNPNYPNGIVINASRAAALRTCVVDLPYPAPECGWFEIRCEECAGSTVVTAAGRPDDPKRIILDCELVKK